MICKAGIPPLQALYNSLTIIVWIPCFQVVLVLMAWVNMNTLHLYTINSLCYWYEFNLIVMYGTFGLL